MALSLPERSLRYKTIFQGKKKKKRHVTALLCFNFGSTKVSCYV